MSKSLSLLLILSVATLNTALKSNDQSSLDVANPTLQFGCTDWCHHLTSGPCQHPDENNEVCMDMIDMNGTMVCPEGMYSCGPRPVRPEPSPAPSKSSSSTHSVTSSSTPTKSVSVSTTPSATSSSTPTKSVSVSATSSSTPTKSVSASTTASSSTAPAGLINGGNVNLGHGNIVASGLDVIQDNYRISFDITLFGTVSNWGSIFHFTKGGDCCSFGQRIPALWFWPSSTRFYWIAGNPSSGDEWVRNDFYMDIGREYHVDLKVVNGRAYQYVDQVCVNGNGQGLRSVGPTQSDVTLYMSDPFYAVPNARVENFIMTEDATVW